jgi:hypothetical protein
MHTLKRNEQGFGAIEALLILVIVILIGVAGWFIYKNHHQAAKPVTSTGPAAVTTNSTNPAPIKVPELGVELVNIPASIKDLTYKVLPPRSSQSYTTTVFTTASLTKLDASCTSIGNLNRYSGTYDASADQGPFTFIKQFSGFWIAFVHNGVECSQDPTTLNLQTTQMQTFKDWVITPTNLRAAQ